ncbi:MAG: YdcF family protein [Alphaproteobacteria bacterium]|nr:YdcF family protein [Alphaproteobacteria bacterium]
MMGAAMLRSGRRAVFVLAVLLIAWLAGLVWFADRIPSPDETVVPQQTTDAVVVLTGGPLRLKAGIELLEAGKAKKLFVSGVSRQVDLSELLRTAQTARSAVACCVALGYDATDTAGNAAETRLWMEHEGFHSLRLVTANYHMQRSLLEFRRAMPDVAIVPNPVYPDSFKRSHWWAWPGTFALIVTEYQKYLAAAGRAWLLSEASELQQRASG